MAAVTVAAWAGLVGAAAGTAGVLPAHQAVADEARMRQHNIALVTTALRVVFTEHRVDQIDRYFARDFVQHSPLRRTCRRPAAPPPAQALADQGEVDPNGDP